MEDAYRERQSLTAHRTKLLYDIACIRHATLSRDHLQTARLLGSALLEKLGGLGSIPP
jgi:hypothetical protein